MNGQRDHGCQPAETIEGPLAERFEQHGDAESRFECDGNPVPGCRDEQYKRFDERCDSIQCEEGRDQSEADWPPFNSRHRRSSYSAGWPIQSAQAVSETGKLQAPFKR